jgi:NADH dehydrogenase
VGLRQEKKERQRQAILDTAIALFREWGFEGTRVQDVTERLRISEATFFNYFPTKQSVLEAAAVDVLDRSTALLYHDVVEDSRPVPDRLEELVRSFAANFAGDQEFAVLLAMHTQLWSQRGREHRASLLLTQLLEEGQRRGEVLEDVPASQLAELFMALLLVTISNWLVGHAGDDTLHERLLRAWLVLRDGAVPKQASTTSPTGQRPAGRNRGAARPGKRR